MSFVHSFRLGHVFVKVSAELVLCPQTRSSTYMRTEAIGLLLLGWWIVEKKAYGIIE